MIYIGDSIVENFESSGRLVWSYYYRPRHALNLGISGDCTQHVLWRLENGNINDIDPRLAILMIGQNNLPYNTGTEISDGVVAIVDFLRRKLPRMKIILLAIFERSKNPTSERAALNAANKNLASRYSSDHKVTYLDVNSIFLRQDKTVSSSLMPDFVHPNKVGYQKWAEALEPTVAALLHEPPKLPMPSLSAVQSIGSMISPSSYPTSFEPPTKKPTSQKQSSYLYTTSLSPTHSPIEIDLFAPNGQSESVIIYDKSFIKEMTPIFMYFPITLIFIGFSIASFLSVRILFRHLESQRDPTIFSPHSPINEDWRE